jgi:hypothetical protein
MAIRYDGFYPAAALCILYFISLRVSMLFITFVFSILSFSRSTLLGHADAQSRVRSKLSQSLFLQYK